MERPVTFVNRKGFRLFGMLYEPDASTRRGRAILISVNAIKYRIGTFRLHVVLARQLQKLGYTVMTFDPEGIGDSEGEFPFKLLSEHYFDIQTGKYDADLRDALEFLVRETGIESVYLFGLCGGAISVLMAGADHPRVTGLILLNVPVLMEDLARRGRETSADKITSTGVATQLLGDKLKRLANPAFWKKLVTLQVDFQEELALVRSGLAVLGRAALQSAGRMKGRAGRDIDPEKPASAHRLYNMHFQRAFLKAVDRRKPLLLVFAEFDQWTSIFKSEFQEQGLGARALARSDADIHVVSGANHIFSSAASQGEILGLVTKWLD